MSDEGAPVEDREPDPSTAGYALGVGVAGSFVVFPAARLTLVNTLGPFGDQGWAGVLAALGVAGVVGALLGWLATVLGRRSNWALAGYVAALTAAAVALFPTPVDRHESFWERPNERSSCLGVSFSHYPPGTSDGATEVYCVGLEEPLPSG